MLNRSAKSYDTQNLIILIRMEQTFNRTAFLFRLDNELEGFKQSLKFKKENIAAYPNNMGYNMRWVFTDVVSLEYLIDNIIQISKTVKSYEDTPNDMALCSQYINNVITGFVKRVFEFRRENNADVIGLEIENSEHTARRSLIKILAKCSEKANLPIKIELDRTYFTML